MRVLYVQYANPGAYPPIQHSARLFAQLGSEVVILGVTTNGTEALRVPQRRGITVRLMRSCRPGVRQKLHYCVFCLWVLVTVIRWRPNWIYVSDALAAAVGGVLTFLAKGRIVYHEHDRPISDETDEVRSFFMRVIIYKRRVLARRAAFCVLPNMLRASQFREETGTAKKVYCVWNCPSLDEATNIIPSTACSPFVVFFHGSIVPQRLPLTVIDALAECSADINLHFAGYETIGHLGYVEELLTRAQDNGISGRVQYLGALPRSESLARCAEAHVGLGFMPKVGGDFNMRTMVGASNKPFDYLLCGLALLVSDLPDWKQAFVTPGYGRACNSDNSGEIARALQWFVDHPRERRQMGEQGRERILDDWNYEWQFREVKTAMMNVTRARNG